MAAFRGIAFALGGIGIVLFAAGVAWALVVQPPCGHATCPSWDTSRLFVNILFLWGIGLVLEVLAVVFLYLHFRSVKGRPRIVAPERRVVSAAPSSPVVTVARRPPPPPPRRPT